MSGLFYGVLIMVFAFAPSKTDLSPIQMAAASAIADTERRANQRRQDEAVEVLKEHIVIQMDLNRFRIAYALGNELHGHVLGSILDDFTLALSAEEFDNSLDRTRRHILMHGITVLMRLRMGTRIRLAHINGIQVAAELAMRLVPTYTPAAIIHASRTLNKLWFDQGVKSAVPTHPTQ